jgi:cytochrome c553
MHNSEDGTPIDPDAVSGNLALLNDGTPSDVCLSCHATRYGSVFGSDPLIPPDEKGGGNFVFLLEDNLNDAANGQTNPISGDAAGHNIDAPSYGVSPDGTILTAPGGTFPSDKLGCTSCHDPHGNQNFRMLYGVGPVQGGLATFSHPAPQAKGLSLGHGSGPETNSNHTAYLSGVSEWCANCHGENYHESADSASFAHPSGVNLEPDIITRYNVYNGTNDVTGGNAATAYLAAVPFEDASATISSTAGPTSSSKVMCLSCHRAHASSAPYAGRWDFNVDLLANDGSISGSYPIPSPYPTPVQNSLCNKCHDFGSGSSAAPVQR